MHFLFVVMKSLELPLLSSILPQFDIYMISVLLEDDIVLFSSKVACRSKVLTLRTAEFNVQQFYVLPTPCICVFCVDLRTNSDYFPIQH